jgi:hypothetical protein
MVLVVVAIASALGGCILVSSNVSSIVTLPRFGPRVLIASGMLLGAAAMTYLTQLTVTSSYRLASALVNTMQQVGGSMGTSALSTIALTATVSYLAAHHTSCCRPSTDWSNSGNRPRPPHSRPSQTQSSSPWSVARR